MSVSLIKVGDVKLAQGDKQGALAAYDEALAIRREIAEAAKGDPQAEPRSSHSRSSRIGDAKLVLGDSAGALAGL